MTDPIADMIVQIKNASDSKKESVVLPYSKLKFSILEVLMQEGFVKSVVKRGKKVVKWIEIGLIYENGMSKVQGVKRESKSSKRIYYKAKDIRSVRSGYGVLIISTPQGITTDKKARQDHIGGEALFKIW